LSKKPQKMLKKPQKISKFYQKVSKINCLTEKNKKNISNKDIYTNK
jgi:hypothetical protein